MAGSRISAPRFGGAASKELPYELDGEARAKTRTLEFGVEPAAVTVCVPPGEDES